MKAQEIEKREKRQPLHRENVSIDLRKELNP
jgi:hypothetical protein